MIVDGLRNRPSVIISSTIADLRDIRSALRFWLEENGCEVWLSEYNDSEKNLTAGNFDACFEAVRRSDFYVLLIGDRRGGWYSEPDVTVHYPEVVVSPLQHHNRLWSIL